MLFNKKCWRHPLAVLVAVTIFLSACAKVGSEALPSACPPVIKYSRAEQARVAEEVAALPEGAVILGWLNDYAVIRAQVSVCAK